MAIDTEDTATIHIFNKRGRGRPRTRVESAKELNRLNQAKHRADQKARGLKQVSIWLSEQSIEAMTALQEADGLSRDEAINNLIEAGLTANS